MEVNVEIKNIDRVKGALSAYPTIATKHFDKAIKKSIFKIQSEVKPLTPVDTGYLRNSQSTMFETLKGIYNIIAEYGLFVEMGTSKMKAQPYLRPGVEKSTNQIQSFFETGLTDTLNEVAGRV